MILSCTVCYFQLPNYQVGLRNEELLKSEVAFKFSRGLDSVNDVKDNKSVLIYAEEVDQ